MKIRVQYIQCEFPCYGLFSDNFRDGLRLDNAIFEYFSVLEIVYFRYHCTVTEWIKDGPYNMVLFKIICTV